MAPPPPVVTMKDFIENDLAIELQDEYDPLAPNNYESIYQERKVKQEKVREEEVSYYYYKQNVHVQFHLSAHNFSLDGPISMVL